MRSLAGLALNNVLFAYAGRTFVNAPYATQRLWGLYLRRVWRSLMIRFDESFTFAHARVRGTSGSDFLIFTYGEDIFLVVVFVEMVN